MGSSPPEGPCVSHQTKLLGTSFHTHLIAPAYSTPWHILQLVKSLSHVRLCDPMDCSLSGFPVHHQLPELAQSHVHRVGDAIQPSHSLMSPFSFPLQSFPASGSFPMSQFFASKGLEFQLQHQSFQWIFRTDFLWDWLVWSPCSHILQRLPNYFKAVSLKQHFKF